MKAKQSEKEFQRMVVQLARLLGWKCVYFRPARVVRRGVETYETPVGGDAAGWPDLVLARVERPAGGDGVRGPGRLRIIFAELKSETGRVDPLQREWAELLSHGQTEVQYCLWRPSQWDSIQATLTGRSA